MVASERFPLGLACGRREGTVLYRADVHVETYESGSIVRIGVEGGRTSKGQPILNRNEACNQVGIYG